MVFINGISTALLCDNMTAIIVDNSKNNTEGYIHICIRYLPPRELFDLFQVILENGRPYINPSDVSDKYLGWVVQNRYTRRIMVGF